MFGSAGKIIGDVQITKRVRQNRVLTDVWGKPLRLVLWRWWRDSQKKANGNRFAGLGRSAALGFPATPGAVVRGTVPVCRRRGGTEFSAMERWIIRRCFRFGQIRFQELPPPKVILEELADEILGHMERLAVIGFDDAFAAMAKYHSLLIDVYAASDDSGRPASFAEISGAWEPRHGEWVATYFRIIERAVKLLDREDEFARTVAYLPRWLLPDDLTPAAPGVVVRLLDLTRSVVAGLEDWIVDRALRAEQSASMAPAELNLTGVDSRRYAETLRSVVGAWESVLSHTSAYFCWEDASTEPVKQWNRFRATWPFLWHHLRNTAYFVAISVWNCDRAGMEHFVDCLLRWPDRLQHDLEQDYLVSREFFSSDLLEMEWPAVGTKVASLRLVDLDILEPESVFAAIVENAWRDVVWITAGIVLGWLTDGKAPQGLTTLALNHLRFGEPLPDREFYGKRFRGLQQHEFDRLFQSLVRMELSGPRWSREGYAAHVNGVVPFLDVLSEKDVIPGGGFTPTTRHNLHDLRLLFGALLLMAKDGQATEQAEGKLSIFIARVETYFGDNGLSALDAYLSHLCAYLQEEESRTYIAGIVGRSAQCTDLGDRIKDREEYARRYMNEIARRRDDRIKVAVIDSQKIQKIEHAIEDALLNNNWGIDILGNFEIRRTQSDHPDRSVQDN